MFRLRRVSAPVLPHPYLDLASCIRSRIAALELDRHEGHAAARTPAWLIGQDSEPVRSTTPEPLPVGVRDPTPWGQERAARPPWSAYTIIMEMWQRRPRSKERCDVQRRGRHEG